MIKPSIAIACLTVWFPLALPSMSAQARSEPNWVQFFTEKDNAFQGYFDKNTTGSVPCQEPDGDGGCIVDVELRSLSRAFSESQRANFPSLAIAPNLDHIDVAYGIDCQKRLLRIYTYFFWPPRREANTYQSPPAIMTFPGNPVPLDDPRTLASNLMRRVCG